MSYSTSNAYGRWRLRRFNRRWAKEHAPSIARMELLNDLINTLPQHQQDQIDAQLRDKVFGPQPDRP